MANENPIPKDLLDEIDRFFRPPDRRRRRSNVDQVREISKLIRLAARLEEAERQAGETNHFKSTDQEFSK